MEKFVTYVISVALLLQVQTIVSAPSEIISLTICEDAVPQKIVCPKGMSLVIHNAYYGRTDSTTCPKGVHNKIDCVACDSFTKVKTECQGKRNCSLAADKSFFGDPCVGTSKYLNVLYYCQ